MKPIRLYPLLMTIVCLALTRPGSSQTMFNTGSKITLVNTCINAGMSTGTYNLNLYYYDKDLAGYKTVNLTGVAVTVSPTVMTITGPANSFPSPSNNGYWSLPDTKDGHIMLTSASSSAIIYWVQKPNDSLTFSCVALPIYFTNFSGYLNSSKQVVLSWQTQMEQNSTYIEIYRYSGGSGGYYKIGQVTAAGNSDIPVSYSFTDPSPCSSNSYYLKMLNSQGTEPITYGYASVGCSTCSCSLPSPVYCDYTINGPDYLCSEESFGAYSLSSPVPNYSTITWSVDQPSLAALTTYPDWDPAAAGLLKKNSAGGVTLTATLSGCTNAISKFVTIGTPDAGFIAELTCPILTLNATNMPGATYVTWWVEDASTSVVQTYPGWGGNFQYDIGTGDVYAFEVQYTNACGTSNKSQISGYWCSACGTPPCGDDPGLMSVSPNPTSGAVTVKMAPSVAGAEAKAVGKAPSATTRPKVFQVQVVDVRGVVQRIFTYPGGAENISLDLHSLNNGVYILRVFDNKTWKSTKVIVAK